MKCNLLFLSCICSLFFVAKGHSQNTSNFYDPKTVQEIKITFAQQNWRYLLDSLRYNGNELLNCSVEVNGTKLKDAGLRYRDGRAFTPGGRRNGLFIKLDQGAANQNYAGHTHIDLSSALRDPSMVREVIGYEIARQYMPAPGANYAKVTINGDYYGLFVNVEVIDKAFLKKHFGNADGSLYFSDPNTIEKAGEGCKANIYGSLQHDNNADCLKVNFTNAQNAQWTDLHELTAALKNSPEKIEEILDVDKALWMLAFNSVTANLHSYSGQHSPDYYLYRNADGKFVPMLGGLNLAFGSFKNTGNGSDLEATGVVSLDPMLRVSDPSKPLSNVLLSNELYRKQYVSHMRAILREAIKDGKLDKRAKELQDLIKTPLTADLNKYYAVSDFSKSLMETIGTRSKIPGIVDFMNKRATYLSSQADFTVLPPAVDEVLVGRREKFSTDRVTSFKVQAKVEKFAKKVYVFYRFADSQPFREATMVDDGKSNDGEAGDGLYGVEIQPEGAADKIEYYIMAENAKAVSYSPARYMYERHKATLADLNK